MKDLEHRRTTIETVYIVLVGFGCILLVLIFGSIWDSSSTRMIIHAILAFLVIIATAAAAERAREKPTMQQLLLIAAFLYYAFVHLGTAIAYLLQLLGPTSTSIEVRTAISLLEVCLFSVLLVASVPSSDSSQEPLSGSRLYITAGFLVLIPLTLHGGCYLFLLQSELPFIHQMIGGFTGFICISALALTGYRLSTQKRKQTDKTSTRLIRGSIVLLLSLCPLLLEFLLPLSQLRMLSLLLQIWAFVFFNRAQILAVLPWDDVPFRPARRFMSLIPSFLAFPLVITLFVELVAQPIIENPLLHNVIHIECAILAAVFLILLFEYSRRKGEWSNFPFIFALSSWACVELATSIFAIHSVPHVILSLFCGIVMILWLFIAILWSSRPAFELRLRDFWILFTLHMAFNIVGIIACFLTQNFIASIFHEIIWDVVFRTGLLIVCFCGMFLVSGLLIFIIRRTRGLLSIEVLSVSIIAIWLSASILRANYPEPFIAWWASEFFILIGLVLGPMMLGFTTFILIGRAETLQHRSELYSDILVHDLRNYHQIIHSSLELLALPERSESDTSEALNMASSGLEKAVRLIHQVRSITKATELNPEKFEKINLVNIIKESWSHIRSTYPSLVCDFDFEPEQSAYYVRANKLLVDVFLNLFNNAIDYSPRDEVHIKVTITSKRVQKKDWWETRVIDWGQGIPDEQKQQLFKRYTASAKGLGLGLSVALALTRAFGGTITAEDRVPGDYSKGTIFIVSLPALKE